MVGWIGSFTWGKSINVEWRGFCRRHFCCSICLAWRYILTMNRNYSFSASDILFGEVTNCDSFIGAHDISFGFNWHILIGQWCWGSLHYLTCHLYTFLVQASSWLFCQFKYQVVFYPWLSWTLLGKNLFYQISLTFFHKPMSCIFFLLNLSFRGMF